MKKILFICETVTMAHIMRTSVLIAGLERGRYKLHLAAGTISNFMRKRLESICTIHPLATSVSAEMFVAHLSRGRLPYDTARIEGQVAEDLSLITHIKPDLVVGDFRLSLAISSKVAKIPYLHVTNSTWHPHSGLEQPVPDLKIVRVFGRAISQWIFDRIRAKIYGKLAKPFSEVGEKWGADIDPNLLELYVSGDAVFFADSSYIAPLQGLPRGHIVGGAILSSLDEAPALPAIENDFPIIVASMGSSGNQRLLPAVAKALSALPVNVLASKAGFKTDLPRIPHFTSLDYLPLKSALEKARLFIHNGGSASGYLSLAAGVPLIAIPSNADQFNFARAVEKKGAAILIRPEKATVKKIRKVAAAMLEDSSYLDAARRIAFDMRNEDSVLAFRKLVGSLV